ncbi:MAG: ECF transporter S component, partial [Lachnospiraceae bacterium]|nr:ECF transporter S component [Lachnospiraceae bacterium]
MKTNIKTSNIVLSALMMCLIMVAIFILRIPVPFTQGYVNLSDGIIFLAVMILGYKYGA